MEVATLSKDDLAASRFVLVIILVGIALREEPALKGKGGDKSLGACLLFLSV